MPYADLEQRREANRVNTRRWLLAHPEYKPSPATLQRKRERARERYQEQRDEKRAYYQNYASRVRQDVMAAYGGRCVCCGTTLSKLLTLDHVNDDGAEQRRSTSNRGIHYWAQARRAGYPKDLQLMCWNCNSGRHRNGGVCPHQDQEAVFDAFYKSSRKGGATCD